MMECMGPHTSSRAPCKERRTLPTHPVTWSWAADIFPPKYCMVRKAHTVTRVTMGTGSSEKLSFVRDEGIVRNL
ncbi:hypothetical protein F7725_016717 [Dissostichus mawsoni]|uniref:Uncharacterized protein n=1 Tax=Dissostichus mawsoni TaxID=36200 RepID=A0A7J5Z2G9_DISMA|nr:hypothetical protein F7725_016717 [Dissostichus mawsoni]